MNGKTHKIVGKIAGVVTALTYMNAGDEPLHVMLEIVGAYCAGSAGAALPDILEPAVHSFHRDVMHSYTIGTGAVLVAHAVIEKWRAYCKQNADSAAKRRTEPGVTPIEVWSSFAEEHFWRFAVGFAAGISAGYVSHLALDAATPRGLPLLTRGC